MILLNTYLRSIGYWIDLLNWYLSASSDVEASAPASEFRDQYRARTSWTYQAEASFSPNVLTSELLLNSRETESVWIG